MAESKDTYKKGLKGIAIFGGLQFYKILLSILTTKVSAIFLGPAGSGIYGLISSTLTTVEAFTSCGLGTSAVKDIAQSASSNNKNAVAKTYTVLNRLAWITGLIGALIIAIFSPYWSKLAFGNKNYTVWFIILSVTLLINQLISGQGALLTGLQEYKLISRLRIITGALSAFTTILCYYFGGVQGIIPVIIGTSIIHLVISILTVKKTKIKSITIDFHETIRIGRPMFLIGISLGINWALTNLSGYCVRIYISFLSDVATVGLFTASFSLVNTYLGLVFTSIESDYFPRLSKVNERPDEYKKTMLQEIELLLFLIIPLVGAMILFSQPALAILYSTKFYAAKSIICWTAFSMIFRVPSWAMSIGIITKGNTRLYLKNQISFIAYQLILNIIGFKYGGLTGLGISYVASTIIFAFQNYIIQKKYEALILSNRIKIILITSLLFGIPFCYMATHLTGVYLYVTGIILLLSISLICLKYINGMTNISYFLKNKLYGKKHN